MWNNTHAMNALVADSYVSHTHCSVSDFCGEVETVISGLIWNRRSTGGGFCLVTLSFYIY